MWMLPDITSPNSDQTMWLVIAAGGIAGLYLILRPRKRKDALAAAPTFPTGRRKQVEHQMNDLLVDLSNMARQITAQLDTRAAKLEVLIKQADERLAALRSATSPPAMMAQPVPEAVEVPATQPVVEVPLNEEPAGEVASQPPSSADPRHIEIYALADAGRAPAEIARLVMRPAGEIELILALRQ